MGFGCFERIWCIVRRSKLCRINMNIHSMIVHRTAVELKMLMKTSSLSTYRLPGDLLVVEVRHHLLSCILRHNPAVSGRSEKQSPSWKAEIDCYLQICVTLTQHSGTGMSWMSYQLSSSAQDFRDMERALLGAQVENVMSNRKPTFKQFRMLEIPNDPNI